jgi:hypothetical protein
MAQVSVRIEGAEVVISKFQKLTVAMSDITAGEARGEMQQARDELATYPAEIPGQRYVRTGKRGRATKLEAMSGNNASSKRYTLESNPQYGRGSGNPYTVGDARGQGQASVHVGRWRLIKKVVDDAVTRIAGIAAQRFRDILGGGPGGF